MAIFRQIAINETTNLLIWKITESLEILSKGIQLTSNNQDRVNMMKSELHQKGFLAIRHMLKKMGYEDSDVIYDEFGKPHLKDGKYISITHSFTYAAIIISSSKPVGIDIEKNRDKILKIAHKFTPFHEYKTIANHDALISKLTIVWGAKESLYKIYGKKKLLFLEHIYVEDFSFETEKTTATITYNNEKSSYEVYFFEFDGFTCVYAL